MMSTTSILWFQVFRRRRISPAAGHEGANLVEDETSLEPEEVEGYVVGAVFTRVCLGFVYFKILVGNHSHQKLTVAIKI